jgi:glycosyltransferase involved in cell wall biosynthesis
MPLEILFFNRSFYPDITATGQLLTELCEDLVKDYNCRVTVICARPLYASSDYDARFRRGRLMKKEFLKGVSILRLRSTIYLPKSFIGRILNYLSYFFLAFIASLKLDKPDLVVTLTDPPIIGLVGLWCSFRFNIPLVISVRDIFPEAAGGLDSYRNQIINFLLDVVNRFCLTRAGQIVAIGKIMRQRLIEKGAAEEKISVISDWADCSNIFPISKENNFSKRHQLNDFFVVMYAGNIGVSSGLEVIIEAANLLRDNRDIKFVFVGGGVRKDKIMQMAKTCGLENVRFFSYQPREMLSEVFSSADIFVIPLKRHLAGYSLPSKVYAVLASGRPYVACVEEPSEIAEITHKFNCGLMARPEDPRDLAEKVKCLYQNKEMRIKMGENSRLAAGSYDRSPGVENYYKLFERLTHGQESF